MLLKVIAYLKKEINLNLKFFIGFNFILIEKISFKIKRKNQFIKLFVF
jgi:hypothetical protein